MNKPIWKPAAIFLLPLTLALFCSATVQAQKGGDATGGEAGGNNLSYPVLWSEGMTKPLPGSPGMTPSLGGAWWYWWGTDPDGNPLSCPPDPDDQDCCDDGQIGTPAEGCEDARGLSSDWLDSSSLQHSKVSM